MANDYREIPIKGLPKEVGTDKEMQTLFDVTHKLSHEALVPLSEYDILLQPYEERKILIGSTNPPLLSQSVTKDVWARKTVAEMLAQVQGSLPQSIRLCVKDAYRPIVVQREYWSYFLELGQQKTGSANPQDWKNFASQYCSNPENFDENDPATWPLHSSGGAVDLTLIGADGKELFMEPKEVPHGKMSHTIFYEEKENLMDKDREGLENRRLLYHSMIAAGFTNYPNEWWHYDFGTRMYARIKNKSGENVKAWYGYIKPPVE